MLSSNKRLQISQPQRKRQTLLHPETLRGILRFTHGSTMRPLYRMQNSPKSDLGDSLVSRGTTAYLQLLHNTDVQRRTQPNNIRNASLRSFHEKIKKEIRTIKSLFQTNTKGAI